MARKQRKPRLVPACNARNRTTSDKKGLLEARYGTHRALGVRYNKRKKAWVLPDGSSPDNCGNCASFIRSKEPNTAIFAFFSDRNPTWAGSHLNCDDHGFAVVDERYIVDPWISQTGRFSSRSVFDVLDPRDAAEIVRLYGNDDEWFCIERPDDCHRKTSPKLQNLASDFGARLLTRGPKY